MGKARQHSITRQESINSSFKQRTRTIWKFLRAFDPLLPRYTIFFFWFLLFLFFSIVSFFLQRSPASFLASNVRENTEERWVDDKIVYEEWGGRDERSLVISRAHEIVQFITKERSPLGVYFCATVASLKGSVEKITPYTKRPWRFIVPFINANTYVPSKAKARFARSQKLERERERVASPPCKHVVSHCRFLINVPNRKLWILSSIIFLRATCVT